jgi:hypothetical protein
MPIQKTATCRTTKRRLTRYFEKKSLSRPMGFEIVNSMEPLCTNSGKMEQVEINAKTIAIHASQILTRKLEKIPM